MAFQAKGDSSNNERAQSSSRGRGRGQRGGSRGGSRGGFRGGHRGGRGRGQHNEGRKEYTKTNSKAPLKCYYCNKPGHKEAVCWKKSEDEGKQEQKSNYAEQENLFLAQHSCDNSSSQVWYVDSGCSNHMTSSKCIFMDLDDSKRSTVRLGDGKHLTVEGLGTISLQTEQGKTKLLHNVQYVPELTHNLLSVGQLLSGGYSVIFEMNMCVIKDKKSGETLIRILMGKNKVFPLDLTGSGSQALVVRGEENAKLWHLRYGHLNLHSLKLLSTKEFVHGLPSIGSLEFCEGCVYGKQAHLPFPKDRARRAGECLQLVHADLCGPMQTESLGGSKYFLLFTDDYSRMSWVYFQKAKSESFENFRKCKALVEKQSGKVLKALRTDRRGEFISNEFTHFCDEHGIRRELTTPYTPQQNGVAERKNRTVVEMARSMMKARQLPNQFWSEAVATAVYLLNISPTKAVQDATPFEVWRLKKPTVSHLKIFGCIAYTLVNLRTKLDDKTEKCIFVGYSVQSKAYRLYNPLIGKIIIVRNVIFDEDSSWEWNPETQHVENPQRIVTLEGSEEEIATTQPNSPATTYGSSVYSSSQGSTSSSESPPARVRSLIDIYESCDFALVATEPTDYEEAAAQSEWKEAMEAEITSIVKNETWELVSLPQGKNAIGLKWVFRNKYNPDGSISKHKARLVVKGYAQQEGVDYEETFSPVARFETVRVVLALAAQWKLPVYQLDVKSAFLNGELLEEVFVEQPEGFVKKGEERKVYKLKKALYALKQAPRAWYNKIDSFFLSKGFNKSENEPTLYVKKQGTNDFIIVCLYVDDIIYFSSSQYMLESFKRSMKQEFEMTDLGILQYFLGLEIKQGKDGIFLCQKKYAKDLLQRFHMEKCEIARTPMNTNEKLQKNDRTESAYERMYRGLIGGLIYLTHTRTDISFSVSVVSRYMHCPTKQHFGAAKRILKYIAGTLDYGLWYGSVKDFKLRGYTDNDWAGCVDDRKSTSSSVFDLGTGAITWSSKKKDTVALSSSEAEYIAAGAAAKQALWLKKLLGDLGYEHEEEPDIWCDNKSTIAMTKNPAFHARTKHIDVQYHFIRQLVAQEKISLQFCRTNFQSADLFTKALNQANHFYFMEKIGMSKLGSRGGVKSDQA
ncbi:unnamed protein product [Cuscuta europaea]|uniref:Integrase catalytic domain-containing protein n=1 Tax=Cuscuta europaea TaxID=41803 RepID=A0A9P0Z023_CUSEU|nr:unnamed protein product [Cuscuta europaea]